MQDPAICDAQRVILVSDNYKALRHAIEQLAYSGAWRLNRTWGFLNMPGRDSVEVVAELDRCQSVF